MKTEIHGLFPTPVYETFLNRDFSKKEINLFEKIKLKTHRNIGNLTSDNHYILNNKILNNLKKNLHNAVVDYFKIIINPKYNIVPYITQSWLNYTSPGQFHHPHEHSNSFISGVLYISADKNFDKILFYNNRFTQIDIVPNIYNPFNSLQWWLPVENKKIILFPSNLKHCVSNKEGDNLRISLAFNVFIKGMLGEKNLASELILK